MVRKAMDLETAKDRIYKVSKKGIVSFPSVLVGRRVAFKNHFRYFYLIKARDNGCGYVSFPKKMVGAVLEIDEVAEE